MIECQGCRLWHAGPAGAPCPSCGQRSVAGPAGWPTHSEAIAPLPGQVPTFVLGLVLATSCCTPAGAIAAVYADQAKKHWERGEEDEARTKLRHAQIAIGVGFVLGLLVGALWLVAQIVGHRP